MNTERVESALYEIDKALNEAKSRSIQALSSYSQLEPEENEIYACFELFWEQDYSLGYNKFFVKSADNQQKLQVEWDETSADNGSFLPEIMDYFDTYYENLSAETEFTQDEGAYFSQKLETSLLGWFADCWQAAGGEDTKVPTYFCFEKEYKVRDLKTGELMSEQEVAHRLGHDVVSQPNV